MNHYNVLVDYVKQYPPAWGVVSNEDDTMRCVYCDEVFQPFERIDIRGGLPIHAVCSDKFDEELVDLEREDREGEFIENVHFDK
jgi:hypothetical protein